MITAEMRSRTSPSDPRHREHRGNPGNPGEGEVPAEGAAAPAPQEGEVGITPLAGEQVIVKTTNYSITPGMSWFEGTNHSQITLAVGRVNVSVELPERGGASLLTGTEQTARHMPIVLVILNPTPEGTGVPNSGMSPEGFPSIPKPVSDVWALPAGVGIAAVTINHAVEPNTLTVALEVRTAGNIPAGKRWLFGSMTGV